MTTILPFPLNVNQVLIEEFSVIAGVQKVFDRPLTPTDPSPAIAVIPADWMPNDFNIGQAEPAIGAYLFLVQAFVKNGDAATGVADHARLAKTIRMMLYRTQTLRVRLGALSETSMGVTERTQRFGIRQQRFLTNEAPQGTFLFLSTTEIWLETEAY